MRHLLLLALIGIALAACDDGPRPTPTLAPTPRRTTPGPGPAVSGFVVDFTSAAVSDSPRVRDYLWPAYSRGVADVRQAFGGRGTPEHFGVERVADLGIPPVTDLGVPVERRAAATVVLHYGARDARVDLTLERRSGRWWVVAITPAR